jgi:hypothetical protein
MATQSQSAAHSKFGPFEVDTEAGELRRNGVLVRLSGQPFQILLILLAHPGEVVTREQLRKEIWAEIMFVDFEHGLNAAMNKLRRALGDAAEKPPVDGGEEQQLLESVLFLNFAVAPDGIFFVPRPADGAWSIRFFSFKTGATTFVAPMEGSAAMGLSVSPDGEYVLYSETDQQSTELMLVENFQ